MDDLEDVLVGVDASRRAAFAMMYEERRRAERAEQQWDLWHAEAQRLRRQMQQIAESREGADRLRPCAAAALMRLELEHLSLRERVDSAAKALREGLALDPPVGGDRDRQDDQQGHHDRRVRGSVHTA